MSMEYVMRRKHLLFVMMLVWLLTAVACGGASQKYELGETLLEENFAEANVWERFVEDEMTLQVEDGAYRIQAGDGGYIWGLNEEEHTDIVIEVSTSQLSAFENNAYGVMCRADTTNNGDGYYFLVSGDGFYAIAKGEGDDVNPLVDWTTHTAVNQGVADNTIRAVCVENYLALYVNDRFLAEIEDSTYTKGYAGFTATAFEGGDVDISFDNLTISGASLTTE